MLNPEKPAADTSSEKQRRKQYGEPGGPSIYGKHRHLKNSVDHGRRMQVARNCAAIRHRPLKLRAEREKANQSLALDEETRGAENEDIEGSDLPRAKRGLAAIAPGFNSSHRAVDLIDAATIHASLISMVPVSYTHLRAHETPEQLVC